MVPETKSPRDIDPDDDLIPYGDVPGPGLLSLFTSFLGGIFGTNPAKSLTWLRKQYGDIVRLYMPVGGYSYIISKPDYIQHVLLENQNNYKKAAGYEELRRIMGEGLLTSEGDKWLRQHRLMMPMFHQKSIMTFGEMIMDETRAMIDRWDRLDKGENFINLLDEMKRITLVIICRALFSSDIEGYVDEVRDDLEILRKGFRTRVRGFQIPLWIPTPMNRKLKRAINNLDEIVNELINERRGKADEYEDFLSMLMLAEDEETGETMSHEQVRDEVMTFFLAGHETTANALTWTWYALTNNPEIHGGLRDHVSSVLKTHNGSFSYELYDDLDYAGRVIKESMRKYPPVPTFGREAIDDDVIGRYEVPAGTTILISQYLTHRSAEIWPHPMKFDPGRFEENKQDERHRFSYFPFGGGARMCIGRELARLEARLILSLVVNEYKLERVDPGRTVQEDVAVTMSPDDPIRMNVTRW